MVVLYCQDRTLLEKGNLLVERRGLLNGMAQIPGPNLPPCDKTNSRCLSSLICKMGLIYTFKGLV